MLGYSVANFAYSRYCVDFLRVSSVRDHLSETPFTASKTYSAFAYLDVYYVLVFRADRFAYCSDLSDELEQKSRIMPRILLHSPINSVMSLLSTTCGVVPVDSDQQRS